MRRTLILTAFALGSLAACGGDDAPAFDRQAAIDTLMLNMSGTVGTAKAPCVREFLDAQSDKALEKMATGPSEELTAAVVACVDG